MKAAAPVVPVPVDNDGEGRICVATHARESREKVYFGTRMKLKNVSYVPPHRLVFATALSIFLNGLDNSIMNVAMPLLATMFHDPQANYVQWINHVDTLTEAAFVVLGGKIGDRFSHTLICQIGLLMFLGSSALCAISVNLINLILVRTIGSIGSALSGPNSYALDVIFSTDKSFLVVMGWNGAFLGLATSLGPLLGGIFAQFWGWRSLFWVHLPVGCVALVLFWRLIPPCRVIKETRFDIIGSFLLLTSLLTFVGLIALYTVLSWWQYLIVGMGLATSLVLFVIVEWKSPAPVLPLAVWRHAHIVFSALPCTCYFAANQAVIFLMPFYLQSQLSYAVSVSGAILCIRNFVGCLVAPLMSKALGFVPTRLFLCAALVLNSGATLLLSFYLDSLPIFIVCLVFLGLCFSAMQVGQNRFVLATAPKAYLGSTAGILAVARSLGQCTGTALGNTLRNYWAGAAPKGSELAKASFKQTLWVFVGFSLVGGVLSLFRGTLASERKLSWWGRCCRVDREVEHEDRIEKGLENVEHTSLPVQQDGVAAVSAASPASAPTPADGVITPPASVGASPARTRSASRPAAPPPAAAPSPPAVSLASPAATGAPAADEDAQLIVASRSALSIFQPPSRPRRE